MAVEPLGSITTVQAEAYKPQTQPAKSMETTEGFKTETQPMVDSSTLAVEAASKKEEQAQEINNEHTNKKYLQNTILPSNLHATSDLQVAANFGETIVVAVPTKAIREVCAKLNDVLASRKLFVHVSKGIEPDSLLRISELMEQTLTPGLCSDIVVLSGPSHAEEVVLQHPTTVTAAWHSLCCSNHWSESSRISIVYGSDYQPFADRSFYQ